MPSGRYIYISSVTLAFKNAVSTTIWCILVNKQPNTLSNLTSQVASCEAVQAAIYFASIDDKATDVCCLDCQQITQHPR